ncbi:MAG: carboxypeptidase-like regulatory domain-containing protein, partial [Euryarchaeota archaeon]|nr:carboxypeptidase-like regulatory domain-containing protein [Euryarchaeota archaeon]
MRGSKEPAAILLILLLAATALSSPGSFSGEHLCSNSTGIRTSGDFKVVNISEDSSFSSQVGCGLVRISVSSDELSQDCVISNTVRAVDSQEQISYNVTISPGDAFNTLYSLPFATTTITGVVYDEYENRIKGAIVEWTDCNDNHVVSDTTDADGEFSLTATSGSYKLKVVYNGVTYPFNIDGTECYNYLPGTYTIYLTIRTTATLTGVVRDEDGNPLKDATVKWTDCDNNYVVADITDADGKFRLTAAAGSYKLKVKYNGIMYSFTINGEECSYYSPGVWELINPLTIPITTTLHGYIKDLDNKPLQGLTVALHDCSGDLAASGDTDSSGHFSITTDAGYYEIFIT